MLPSCRLAIAPFVALVLRSHDGKNCPLNARSLEKIGDHDVMSIYTISFPNSESPSLTVSEHQPLAEVLTVQNSPILFGCRTGICGTCLVEVSGNVTPPGEDERELLEILAPGHPQARLACQLDLTGDIAMTPLQSA